MNKYTLLLLAILIAFLSCDGRDRVHKTNKEVLIENKLLDSFSENIKYFPETYAETVTDTILSNGFRVKIKTFTDMENSVLNSFEVDNKKHKHYFREIVSEIVVFRDKEQIFSKKINKLFFIKQYNLHEDQMKNLVLESVRLEQEVKPFKGYDLVISFWFKQPNEPNNYLSYELNINSIGETLIRNFEI